MENIVAASLLSFNRKPLWGKDLQRGAAPRPNSLCCKHLKLRKYSENLTKFLLQFFSHADKITPSKQTSFSSQRNSKCTLRPPAIFAISPACASWRIMPKEHPFAYAGLAKMISASVEPLKKCIARNATTAISTMKTGIWGLRMIAMLKRNSHVFRIVMNTCRATKNMITGTMGWITTLGWMGRLR